MINKTENIFGKIRGRFDEDHARRIDTTLKSRAMAALVAMPEEEWQDFIKVFNDTFKWGTIKRKIVQS
jgi:hypothetical protein